MGLCSGKVFLDNNRKSKGREAEKPIQHINVASLVMYTNEKVVNIPLDNFLKIETHLKSIRFKR
jgi:hypothetical protein